MSLNPVQEYLAVLKKGLQFEGRSRRREAAVFIVTNICLGFLAGAISGILAVMLGEESVIALIPQLLFFLFALVIFIPALSLNVRRLHDWNQSGILVLILFVPCIGAIFALINLVVEGTQGDNKYGPDPKSPVNNAQYPQDSPGSGPFIG